MDERFLFTELQYILLYFLFLPYLTSMFCILQAMNRKSNEVRAILEHSRTESRSKRKFGTIRQSVFLRATPLEVYHALIDPKKHAEFTHQGATGEPTVGGSFTAGDGYITGKNVELKEGKLIVQQWRTTEWSDGFPHSLVKFSFRKQRGGTRLLMVHSKVPATQRNYYRKGWEQYYWTPLKQYLSEIKTANAKC
jgi:uncharacterized protein YndB with AHSA1/START domain